MNLDFANPLFIIPTTSGLIFIITGYIMLRFPPKKINALYGYRTKSSMKTQERWDFSQKYSAKELMKLGALLALSGLVGALVSIEEKMAMVLGLVLTILVVMILLLRVEKAIKRKFQTDN